MKLYLSDLRKQGMTMFEVFVVIAIVLMLAIMLLPWLAANKRHAARINCVSNLKQVNVSFRVWEADNNNKYPMAVSVTNYGGMELIATGNVAGCLQVMSNELSTPKILICPQDTVHSFATNFATLKNSNISYFLNPDASEAYPQQIMIGDDNFAIGGVPVKSGLLVLPSNTSISWTAARHGRIGNIGFADGSVSEVTSVGLQSALALSTNGTPFMTNRLAIP